MNAFIAALRQIVGAAHVLTHEEPGADLTAWEQDWRGRMRGRALAVVRPADTPQVAAVVRACVGAGVSIVPQGGNTGLVLGSVPDGSGTQVVLSLCRLDAVCALDGANLSITAQAGCILQNLQTAAQEAGFLFPLSLAAKGSCTLGGNLSTNAGGTQVLRYGNARELCLGLEVVTAQGQIWQALGGLRKDNMGYDLRQLYIGSEGTLGIITAASMRLYPLPAARVTAWAAVPSVQAAVALLGLAQRSLGAGLTGFELMNQEALRLVVKHFASHTVPLWQQAPYCVLLEHSASDAQAHERARCEAMLNAALAQGLINNAVVAHSLSQAQQLWGIREHIPSAQAQEGLNIKHDISLPISSMAAFCAHTQTLLEQAIPGVRLVNFGHLGDGNLHYNVQAPPGGPYAHDPKAFVRDHEHRINTLVFDAVARYHGSTCAEHGVGSLKAAHLAHYKDATALDLMHRIKQALDPHNLMNPGRVLLRPAHAPQPAPPP